MGHFFTHIGFYTHTSSLTKCFLFPVRNSTILERILRVCLARQAGGEKPPNKLGRSRAQSAKRDPRASRAASEATRSEAADACQRREARRAKEMRSRSAPTAQGGNATNARRNPNRLRSSAPTAQGEASGQTRHNTCPERKPTRPAYGKAGRKRNASRRLHYSERKSTRFCAQDSREWLSPLSPSHLIAYLIFRERGKRGSAREKREKTDRGKKGGGLQVPRLTLAILGEDGETAARARCY